MKASISLLGFFFLSLALAAALIADTPRNEFPVNSEMGFGYVKPIYSPGGAVDSIAWQSIANAPVGIGRTSSGVIGDYVYFFGSGTGNATGIAYHIPTNTWVNSVAPPLVHRNYCGVVANGCFYLFGRYDQVNLVAYGDLQRFTPTGGGPLGVWDTLACYPVQACGFTGDWDGGNYVYLSGGSDYTGGTYRGRINLAHRYNLSTNQYEVLPAYPDTCNYSGGKWFDGKFYVMGGTNNSGSYLDVVRAFNPATNQWENKASLPQANGFLLFSTSKNSRYIFCVGGGGGYSTWPAIDAVQVYDPYADAWFLESPLPVNYGLNSAVYVQDGNYILRVGGYNGSTWFNVAYKGLNPPGGPLLLTLTPRTTPIQLPPSGGNIIFSAEIENLTNSAVNFDAWTEVILPNGTVYGPIIERFGLTAPGSATIMRQLSQNVPGIAPPGNYTYVGKVRALPDSMVSLDSFPFTKLAGDAAPNPNQGWTLHGWDDEEKISVPCSQFSVLYSSPNPFNASTAISFELRVAGNVKMAVYDIQGREVARLAEGYYPAGTHQAVWEASAMSSGVYFARLTAEGMTQTQKLLLVK